MENNRIRFREELRDGSLYAVSYHETGEFASFRQTYPLSFDAVINGVGIRGMLRETGFASAVGENGTRRETRELECGDIGVKITVNTVFDAAEEDSLSFTRSVTFENTTDKAVVLTSVQVFGGSLFAESFDKEGHDTYEVGYMHEGVPTGEGDFYWEDITPGEFGFGVKRYEERFRMPFAIVHDKKSGDCAVMSLGFSGGFSYSFANTSSMHFGSELSFAVMLGSYPPVRVLEAGESATTPVMHMTYAHAEPDDAMNYSNDHIRRFASKWKKEIPVECSCMTNREENVLKTIGIAKDCGAEVMYIDAGWYIPSGGLLDDWPAYCGDWEREPDTYSSSLLRFREMCHESGIKFGLWMDVEKIGFKTETYASGKLPYLTDYENRPIPDGPSSYMVDITHPDAAKWLCDEICHVIDTYKLDYFRLDSGAFPVTAQNTRCGIRESADWRYYDALYGIMEKLRVKYPDVIFQNCAGGGGRIDTGLVSIMSNTWISDCNSAPYSFRIINGVSMLLPVEYCVKIINEMGAEVGCTDYYKLNIARFGGPLIPISMDSPEFRERTKKALAMYKKYIRPMLDGCRVYHHTPEAGLRLGERDAVGILEAASKDCGTVMISAFTLGEVTEPEIILSPRGVSSEKKYRVWLNDEECGSMSGEELADGVKIRIAEPHDSVCMICVAE